MNIKGTEVSPDAHAFEKWLLKSGDYPRALDVEILFPQLGELGIFMSEHRSGEPVLYTLQLSLEAFDLATPMAARSDLKVSLRIILRSFELDVDPDSISECKVPATYEDIDADLDWTPPVLDFWRETDPEPWWYRGSQIESFDLKIPSNVGAPAQLETLPARYILQERSEAYGRVWYREVILGPK